MAPNTDMSFSMEDFAKALDAQNCDFQKGQVVMGKIAQHVNDGAYVDIGGKAAAFLPTAEATLKAVIDLSATLPVDESFEFMVIRDQNEDGQVTISRRQMLLERVWEELAEQAERNATLEVRVTGSNRGGVTVDVQSIRGFIPRSQLNDAENMEGLKGRKLQAKLIEVNPETRKIILSERKAVQSVHLAQLEVGQLITGPVTGLKPFGAFVNMGGTTGLLHVSQISEKSIADVATLFKVGQVVQALIVDIDEGRGRISLSTKALENFPGEVIENFAAVMASSAERAERARNKLDANTQI